MHYRDGLDANEISEITTVIISAALGHVQWADFLEFLSLRTHNTCTHIIGFDTEAAFALDMAAGGYDPDYVATYRDHYTDKNPWAAGFVSHSIGVPIPSEEMYPTEDLVKTEFYHDWLRPQDEIIYGGGALLFKDQTRLFALGGNIRKRDADKAQVGWMRAVEQLVPHLQQAFEVSRALAGAKLETAIVARQGLRTVPGIVILSEAGSIVFANSIAQAMLDIGDPIGIDWRGFLCLRGSDQRESVAADFLRTKLADDAPSFTLTVPAADGGFHCLRFAKLSPEAGIGFPLDAVIGLSGHCSIVVITKSEAEARLSTKLRRRWGLTEAEAEVASHVYEGRSARDVADARDTSVHTVRHQIKAAMAKLGVRRQAELVREIRRLDRSYSPFGR